MPAAKPPAPAPTPRYRAYRPTFKRHRDPDCVIVTIMGISRVVRDQALRDAFEKSSRF